MTTAQTARTVTRRRRRFILVRTLLNPIAKLMLRSPLHGFMSGRLLLISFTGRRSGQRYTTPVAYVRDGDDLLLGVGGPWWRNLRGGAPVQVRVRGRSYAGVAQVVTDDAGMSEAYRTILTLNPTQARFMGIKTGPDGRPDAGDVRRAIERGAAVVRVRLND